MLSALTLGRDWIEYTFEMKVGPRRGGFMKTSCLLVVAACCLGLVEVRASDCVSGPVQAGVQTAEFKGVTYDAGKNRSTWYYSFTSGTKPAISHVTFELLCPDVSIVDAGMWSGCYPSSISRISKGGMPKPGTFPSGPLVDPTTGFKGLKFDLGFADFQSRNYYFTLAGQYASAPTRIALKGATTYVVATLCGPSGSCESSTLPVSSLGDRVWFDADGNGVQNEGETGVSNVTVRLLAETDDILRETTTDANGYYLFADLHEGVYRVQFILPSGYVFTEQNAGSNDEVDSDADRVTGVTATINLPASTDRRDVDAGLILRGETGIRLEKTGTFIGSVDPWDACDVLGLAGQFNALIFGDLSVAGSGDTEGRLAVGGSASIANGYSVGMPVVGDSIEDFHSAQVDSFIVASNLTDGAWGVNGNIVYGGDRIGPARYMINGNVVRKQTPVTFDSHGNVPPDGGGVSFADIYALLLARSADLADLADQGVVAKERNPAPFGDLQLTGEHPALNVFNISAADWSVTSAAINVSVPSNSLVVINVRGASVVVSNATMNLSGVSRDHLLVHFVDAESILLSSFTHEGSLLAMHASANLQGGSINGRAVIGGSVETSRGFEFHNFSFDGELCLGAQTPPEAMRIAYAFTVHNTGTVALAGITIHDPLVAVEGGPISLSAGASDATSFTAVIYVDEALLAAGGLTNIATVSGHTADGRVVTAADDDEQVFPSYAGSGFIAATGTAGKADFEVQSVTLVPSPSMTYTRFRVQVRVVNSGDAAGIPHSVSVWPSLDAWDINPLAAPEQVATDETSLASLASRVYEFGPFTAPGAVGTYHAIARVSTNEAEYSYGNNFGGATYSLEPVEVSVETAPNGNAILRWNSAPDYYFFVDRADALDQPFVDIADNLPATPPLNEYTDTTAPATPAFYRVWGYKP